MLAFWVLVASLSVWVSWKRPLSALWRAPLLLICCGPPTGLAVWHIKRKTDLRLARAALLMQTVGLLLAVVAIGAAHEDMSKSAGSERPTE
jgi:hypothetical protein